MKYFTGEPAVAEGGDGLILKGEDALLFPNTSPVWLATSFRSFHISGKRNEANRASVLLTSCLNKRGR